GVDAYGGSAQPIVTDQTQAGAEWRTDDSAVDHQKNGQDHERVVRGGYTVEGKRKEPQDRRHTNAMQTVGATGKPGPGMAQLEQYQRHPQGDHDHRQGTASKHGVAADIGRNSPDAHGEDEPDNGFGHDKLGEESRSEGSKAEEGRMPQRHDSRVAKYEI